MNMRNLLPVTLIVFAIACGTSLATPRLEFISLEEDSAGHLLKLRNLRIRPDGRVQEELRDYFTWTEQRRERTLTAAQLNRLNRVLETTKAITLPEKVVPRPHFDAPFRRIEFSVDGVVRSVVLEGAPGTHERTPEVLRFEKLWSEAIAIIEGDV